MHNRLGRPPTQPAPPPPAPPVRVLPDGPVDVTNQLVQEEFRRCGLFVQESVIEDVGVTDNVDEESVIADVGVADIVDEVGVIEDVVIADNVEEVGSVELGNQRRATALSLRDKVKQQKSFLKKVKKIQRLNCCVCTTSQLVTKAIRNQGEFKCSNCKSSSECKRKLALNLKLGEQPPELAALETHEEMCIAICSPQVLCCQKGTGRQLFYNGNTCVFPQDNSGLLNAVMTLPRTEIDVITLKRVDQNNGVVRFPVDRARIFRALEYLKAHCPPYRYININRDAFADREEVLVSEVEGELGNFTTISSEERPVHICNPGAPPERDEEQDINELLGIEDEDRDIPYPRIDRNSPVSEFETPYLLTKCFPTLFPNGEGDYFHPNSEVDLCVQRGRGPPSKISLDEYVELITRTRDLRFLKHKTVRYFFFNLKRRHAILQKKKFQIALHYNDIVANENGTVDISLLSQAEKKKLVTKIKSITKDMPGTDGYWRSKLGELYDIVDQLGIPSLFATFSAADSQWPDMLKYLRETTGDMDSPQYTLVANFPELVTEFCNARFKIYLADLVKRWNIKNYWCRLEFQSRGSVHYHCLFWIKDAPSVHNILPEEHARIRAVCNFFDQFVTANHPFPDLARDATVVGERDHRYLANTDPSKISTTTTNNSIGILDDLAALLDQFQTHKCLPYCLRTKKNTREEVCRFDFDRENGKPLHQHSTIEFVDGVPKFVAARNHPFLNNFQPEVTTEWRANTDIQVVVHMAAVKAYLAKYVAKIEESSPVYLSLFDRIAANNPDGTPKHSLLRRLALRTISDRDYSSQEVAFANSLTPLVLTNVNFQTINPLTGHANVDGENVIKIGLNMISCLEKYKNRDREFEHLTMFQLFKNNRLVYRRNPQPGQSKIFFSPVDVPFVVRVFPNFIARDAQNEMFCKREVLVHSVFREVPDVDFVEFYNENDWNENQERNTVTEDVQNFVDREMEFEETEQPQLQMFVPAFAQIHNLRNFQDVENPIDDAEYENAFNGPCEAIECDLERKTKDDAKNYIDNVLAQVLDEMDDVRNTDEAHQYTEEELNDLQFLTYKHASTKIENLTNTSQLHLVVYGVGGTGKSHLIHSIRRKHPRKVKVATYTGLAAFNIQGQTIHSLLALRTNDSGNGLCPKLRPSRKSFLKRKLKDCNTLILDEFSMIGAALLAAIDERLRDLFDGDKPFGGLNIIYLGDLAQLPPVKAMSVISALRGSRDLSRFERCGFTIFESVQEMIELKVNQRIQTSESGIKLKNVLTKIREGDISQELHEQLGEHCSNTNFGQGPDWQDAIHLFAKKKECFNHNMEKMNQLPKQKVLLKASNSCERAKNVADDVAQGLPNRIVMAVGCRVMLRKNIKQSVGLFNGAMGTVKWIKYADRSSPSPLPDFIAVEFDTFTGPAFIAPDGFDGLPENNPYSKIVPIMPYQSVFGDTHHNNLSRTQYPLEPCYGITIHKSQGLTLTKGVIHLGDREYAQGLTYVAMSRFKELDQLTFPITPSYSRLLGLSKRKSKAVSLRLKWEVEVLKPFSLATTQKWRADYGHIPRVN